MLNFSTHNLNFIYVVMLFKYFNYIFHNEMDIYNKVSDHNITTTVYEFGFRYHAINVIDSDICYRLCQSNTSLYDTIDIDYTDHFYNNNIFSSMLKISVFMRYSDGQYSGFILFTDKDVAECLVLQVALNIFSLLILSDQKD